jgi:hypothetical protein
MVDGVPAAKTRDVIGMEAAVLDGSKGAGSRMTGLGGLQANSDIES